LSSRALRERLYASGMSSTTRALLIALAALAACGDNRAWNAPEAGVGSDATVPQTDDYIFTRLQGEPGKPRVLVYTFENYWRHYSNLSCMVALMTMQTTRGFTVLVTNHPNGINAKNLAEVDVVAFCVTSGSGMSAQSKSDLEAWIRAGGGTVGFHSAAYTEPGWSFYLEHVGTGFATHAPGAYPATVNVNSAHPITEGISDFQLADEWYVFSQRPDTIPGAQVLLAVDENTLPPEYPLAYKQGYHPFAWTNERFGGRMFYSSFGHTPETFSNPIVVEIIGRAIEWAAHQR
jgi:type 1 glutamine amidotransferase